MSRAEGVGRSPTGQPGTAGEVVVVGEQAVPVPVIWGHGEEFGADVGHLLQVTCMQWVRNPLLPSRL